MNRRTSARKVGTIGERGWNTRLSAAAAYVWPPLGSTPGRPRALMAAARSGDSVPLMTETFAAAFSNTPPFSMTRVTPNPEPVPERAYASSRKTAGRVAEASRTTSDPISNASVSMRSSAAQTDAWSSTTNDSNASRSTPFVSMRSNRSVVAASDEATARRVVPRAREASFRKPRNPTWRADRGVREGGRAVARVAATPARTRACALESALAVAIARARRRDECEDRVGRT